MSDEQPTGVLTTKERLMRIETKVDFLITSINKDMDTTKNKVDAVCSVVSKHDMYFKIIWVALSILGTVILLWLGPIAAKMVEKWFGGG